jgi:hypothetical protein
MELVEKMRWKWIPRDIPTNVITSIDWSPDGQLLE